MERLTYRGENGKGYVGSEYHGSKSTEQKRAIVADRLAAYEDTGLSPEDVPTGLELAEVHSAIRLLKQYEALGTIDELTALVKARDDGRVVVLPCKVGDAIYIRDSQGNVLEMTADAVAIVDSDGDANLLDWFGKVVFASSGEAEMKGAVDHEAN